MSKPLIGVVPLWDEQKKSLWMMPGYMDGIEQAGGLPVMLPLSTDERALEQICQTVDGLLFTGGQDVSPVLYKESKSELCGEVCEMRDEMEVALFSRAVMELNKPAFGICRGIQFFNAFMGGTLHQHLEKHQQKQPYSEPLHKVKINQGSPLSALLKTDEIAVNSCHHQGIKDLSQKLVCMAVAECGLVEAVYVPGRKFAWAVQWHPEYSLQDENSRVLFEAFIKETLT